MNCYECKQPIYGDKYTIALMRRSVYRAFTEPLNVTPEPPKYIYFHEGCYSQTEEAKTIRENKDRDGFIYERLADFNSGDSTWRECLERLVVDLLRRNNYLENSLIQATTFQRRRLREEKEVTGENGENA